MKKNTAALLAWIFALALASQSFAAVSSFHFFDPTLLASTNVQGQTFAPESGSPLYQATLYGGKLGLHLLTPMRGLTWWITGWGSWIRLHLTAIATPM